MIRGVVNDYQEATLRLRLHGDGGKEMEIDATVDTGFSASLTLPASTVALSGLKAKGSSSAQLADGSTSRFDIYEAVLDWGEDSKEVVVYAVGDEPLVGMRLLAGNELRIEVAVGGVVEITPLSNTGKIS